MVDTVDMIRTPSEIGAVPSLPIYRLSVEQYQQMITVGIIPADAPVELLEGWLAQKVTKNPPHIGVLGLVRRMIERSLSADWHVNTEQPITTSSSMPEPDCSVIRGTPRDYMNRLPMPADVGLIIEVSDTTLSTDRGQKLRIYAKAGIPIYWIVNIPERQIEVYTKPKIKGELSTYLERVTYEEQDTIPIILDGKTLGQFLIADILP